MAKKLELMFAMTGKLAPEFLRAAKSATAELKAVEKSTKDIQKAAERRASVNSWKVWTQSVTGAKSAVGSLKNEMKGLLKIGAGLFASNGLIGGAIYGVAKSSAGYADAAHKTAQGVGMTTAAYSELAYAAGMAGASEQQFGMASAKLSKLVTDAAQGNQKALEVFTRAGVDFRDEAGKLKSVERLWGDFADSFSSMEDGVGKTRLITDMVGEEGRKLVPFLNGGSKAMNEMREAARRMNITLSEQDGKNAEAFNDSFANIGWSVRGASLIIGRELWPTLTKVHEFIGGKLIETSNELAVAIKEWDISAWWDATEPKLNEAWASVKDGIKSANDFAQSMGGWVPLVKTAVKWWMYWRGIRLAKTFYDTGKAVRDMGRGFLGLQHAGVSVGGAFKTMAGGIARWTRAGIGGVRGLAASLARWPATIKMVSGGVYQAAVSTIKHFGAMTKSALFFTGSMVKHAAASVASFAVSIGSKLVPVMTGLATSLYAGAAAALKFGIALMANPVGLAIAGIAALGGTIYLCVKHWDSIKAAVGKAWDFIQNVFVSGWNNLPGWMQRPLTDAYESVAGFVKDILDIDFLAAGMEMARNLGNGILSAWSNIKDGIKSAVLDWIPGGSSIINGLGSAADGVANAASWVTGKVSSIMPFADGGLVTRPQMALVGEAGPEVIVPVSRPSRAREMMDTAAGMIGMRQGGNGGINLTFNPTITIAGNADHSTANQLERVMRRIKDQVLQELKMESTNARRMANW
ncbi:MAG: hypothetical protein LUC93_03055 [Planctomycetaceae bacterium]|nr:hypothetical protein [Planctomycetaceae bacterium]